ncbi:PREDICTED: gastrin-releasing peptide receptor-like [Wasmannia auropunctata]|uniref:gastrin-releasing peptide receptor-like n=1 Tax=Wasmannia auropunctata TaxID=64793 RepID=UPI0005F00C60|nr:PREDICTED: gastrin-releasing peptide receptor-like [Wasmannia auropunctata]XP_011704114.1 PREDICTED: gastrin-releasing peptide receptor-like [Wasmannia auropunctata]XP_011704115.1 PREDICTED: gastrin-releasing peptide receptor-like [Wasmannia auropunctata]XP_011704116.1 PREDICTED: gastrin-releasing peptide receptor-like [Wasmannia auropunctata]XP_011704117.1 PREDICTED: gastrin-releasing peptide receptor-like [Wasmannia auropunctata]XP_011704118.1 PREDICTED: gastrin-releasing peptide receptor
MTTADDIFNITLMDYDENVYIPYEQRPETYFVPVLFSLILIVGVIGNGILILILLCDPNMRNIPNTYVLSLAVGDLLIMVTSVPFTSVIYTVESWPWGETICKLSECAKDISIGVSVFTLAALAAERYCAIVNPIRRHMAGLRANPLTILTVTLIWVLAIVLAMPSALFANVYSIEIHENLTISICSPFPEKFGMAYEKGIVMFKFLAYYVIPLCVIASFYLGMAWNLTLSTRNMPGELPGGDLHTDQIQARKRVGKMVVCFIIVFVICFLPYHIFMLWFHFTPTAQYDYNYTWHYFRIVGFCLSFSNSCVNPIALYLISRTFREKFNRYLCCCLPGVPPICGRTRMKNGMIQGHSVLSQRRRRLFHETSFGSTSRRRTQDSTAVFEMNSINLNKANVGDRNLA